MPWRRCSAKPIGGGLRSSRIWQGSRAWPYRDGNFSRLGVQNFLRRSGGAQISIADRFGGDAELRRASIDRVPITLFIDPRQPINAAERVLFRGLTEQRVGNLRG